MSNASNLPADVRQFLQSCISSALQVEVLLLLAGNKDTSWTAPQVSARLRSDAAFVGAILSDFHDFGLLGAADMPATNGAATQRQYRYQPASGDLERVIEALAQLYRERRHNVLEAIYSHPQADSLQAFSDAFSLKPPPRGQGQGGE